MGGMCKHTGKYLNDIDHLKQSIEEILTTPIGTRCMNRKFGASLFDLVDSNASNIDIYASVAKALKDFEPRFNLKKINTLRDTNGSLYIDITGEYVPTKENISSRIKV